MIAYARRGLSLAIYTYLALGTLGVLCLQAWGQENLTTAALMFLPPLLWVLPALILALPALVLHPKSLIPLLGGGMLFTFGHLGYQWQEPSPPPASKGSVSVRVLSWNRGQSKGASLQELNASLRPDLIVLQDSPPASYYKNQNRTGYLEYPHVSEVGEFVLLSRWPIESAEMVASDSNRAKPVAARFVVTIEGQKCAVFNVHLRSPRNALNSYKRGAFLWGILGFPGSPWEAKKRHYEQFWNDQIAAARKIAQRAKAETMPTVVAGDFNGPAFGPIYRMFHHAFQDSHEVSGEGFGFTFPGITNNPLVLFRPWLRLDQVFASSEWQILESAPQAARAQHLPVFTRLSLKATAVVPSAPPSQ